MGDLNAPLEATRQMDRRIDHVLVRPGRPGRPVGVVRAFAVDEPVAGMHPADHAAAVVDLVE